MGQRAKCRRQSADGYDDTHTHFFLLLGCWYPHTKRPFFGALWDSDAPFLQKCTTQKRPAKKKEELDEDFRKEKGPPIIMKTCLASFCMAL